MKKEYRNFEDAKKFVHSLKLKNKESWYNFAKTTNRPVDIPKEPRYQYLKKGWKGWGDWLGTGRIATQLKQFKNFEEARTFSQKFCFKSIAEWKKYSKSGKRPKYIPSQPDKTYKNKGWISWGDWLGTDITATYNFSYESYSIAKKFVHSLNLKSKIDWANYCKTKKMKHNIPKRPDSHYKNTKEWVSWGDWLGTGRIADQLKQFKNFEEARSFVHSLNLESVFEWKKYCKSGNKPIKIPSNPNKLYKNKGWISWGDWLGTNSIAPQLKKFRNYQNARLFIQKLGLKNRQEWREYVKSGKLPSDIPHNPEHVYAKKKKV